MRSDFSIDRRQQYVAEKMVVTLSTLPEVESIFISLLDEKVNNLLDVLQDEVKQKN